MHHVSRLFDGRVKPSRCPAAVAFGGWRGVNSLGPVESIRVQRSRLSHVVCLSSSACDSPCHEEMDYCDVAHACCSTAAVAQQTQNQYEPPNAPGAGQKLLAQFAGDWDLVKTFFPMNGKPIVTKGTCKQYMIEDGKFLQSDFTFFDSEGSKSTGTGISGFDSKTNRFITVWYDSRQTTISIRQSDGTFDGKNIVLWATPLDPDRPGRKTVARAHLEENGRVLLHRHFLIDDKGEERMMLELRLTRK